VLGLQADMAAKQARCYEKLAQILKARNSAVQGIATRESLPVWSPDLWSHSRTALPHRLQDIARGFQTSFWQYVRDPSRGMPLHAALLLVLTMTTCAARRKKRQWNDSGVGVSPIVKVFDHPYSASLTLVLLVATAVNSPAPTRVKDVFAVLALAPMIGLVRPVIDPRLVPAVLTAAILYAVDLVRQTFGGTPLVEQALLIVESLAAIVMLGWLLHSGRLGSDSEQKPEGLRARFLPPVAKLLMFSFAIGCLAATLGFTRWGRLITPATLSGGVLALSLYAYVRVGVNYGAAPQAMIELLEKTAQAHAAVLESPPPRGLFMGYGDSSINFELRTWTAQFANWAVIRSELASAVYDAVRAAGMSFPFPQREVRILGDSAAPAAADPRPVGCSETTQEEG
jgi:hypothetical protein